MLIPSQSSCLTTEPRLYSCLHLITGLKRHFPSPATKPSSQLPPHPLVAGKASPTGGAAGGGRAPGTQPWQQSHPGGVPEPPLLPPARSRRPPPPGSAAEPQMKGRALPSRCHQHRRASLNSIKARNARKPAEIHPSKPVAGANKGPFFPGGVRSPASPCVIQPRDSRLFGVNDSDTTESSGTATWLR